MPNAPSTVRCYLLVSFAICLMLALPARALAHEVGLSRGTYTASGNSVTIELVLSRKEATSAVSGIDADQDGRLTEAELTAAGGALQKAIVDRVRVHVGDAPCPGELDATHLSEEDGLELKATYTCVAPIERANVEVELILDLAHGHRHIARSTVGSHVTETVLSRGQRTLELVAAPGAPAPKRDHLSMFVLGLEHILTGYDHLVFLFGLVLVGGRLRSLLGVVTAFTVAHSITLGLSALKLWAPRPSIVEPAIALSIAYVGVENFFVKSADKRWRITFPFGLIHGFGFAGALQEVALPRADIPSALFLFNLGVEAGQIAVLALVLPILALLRKQKWFETFGIKGASVLIVIAGLVWFFMRVAG